MSGFGSATEFVARLDPHGDALEKYDNTKTWEQQPSTVPQIFRDALSVREEVFGQQGVPLEVEVDEDDARSWHWVTYASVAQTSSPPPNITKDKEQITKAEEERRASATAQRVAVGTIRLIPPPHGPNPYKQAKHDKHPDADPPASSDATHPNEPYIKLGRLSVLGAYRGLSLSKMLINTALEYASKNPGLVCPAPPPTTLEAANRAGKCTNMSVIWNGLVMVHAQDEVADLWARHGFSEELVNDKGEVEIRAEDRWREEGIEHMAMWKRLKLETGRL